jgi:RNA polymerase sigma factor (sigma-70 family)
MRPGIADVLRHLQRAAALGEAAHLSDGQLLDGFVERADPVAFEEIVRRHGPMVLGVCRRLVRHEQDVEDAFQAVFLVLVRKAAGVQPRGKVGNWLYGVACRIARRARDAAQRRHARERQVEQLPERGMHGQDSGDSADLLPLLDEELTRLPDRYRAPVVLCDLEGRPYQEAARLLGCPEGTVASRLSRARQMLARRLSRRGVTLPAGGLVAALAVGQSSACGPLAEATVRTACLCVGGEAGTISAQAIALAEGVMRTMLLTRIGTWLAVVLVAGLLACGGWRLAAQPAPAPPREPEKAAETPAAPRPPEAAAPIPPPKRGPNREADLAAKWLEENRDKFLIGVDFSGGPVDPAPGLLLAINKNAAHPAAKVHEITQAEAAALVRAVVDCGLWYRSDTIPGGPLPPGRYLSIQPPVGVSGVWRLGGVEDDISSMYIIREILSRSEGERKEVLKRWLEHGVARPKE